MTHDQKLDILSQKVSMTTIARAKSINSNPAYKKWHMYLYVTLLPWQHEPNFCGLYFNAYYVPFTIQL